MTVLCVMFQFGPFGALRIILVLIAIYYIARWWSRSQQQKRQAGSDQGRSRKRSSSRHGDVTVEYTKEARNKKSSSDSGDYVDFEEVD